MNRGIDLLLPRTKPLKALWPGGEGLLAVNGVLDGAQVQLAWAPNLDTKVVHVGESLSRPGSLSPAFNLPRGVVTVAIVDGTSNLFATAAVYRIPTNVIRGAS